jgi:hypothetical protein
LKDHWGYYDYFSIDRTDAKKKLVIKDGKTKNDITNLMNNHK